MRKALLIFSLSLLTAASASAYTYKVENEDGKTIYYDKLNSTSVAVTYEVSYNQATESYTGEVVIPSTVTVTINEQEVTYNVTKVGDGAFWGCTGLTSVTVPETVTEIDFNAFRACTALTSVTLPSTLSSLGGYVFLGCSSLVSIVLPEGITTINYSLFQNCTSLTTVNVPQSVTTIEGYAFANCSSLTSIDLPDTLTSISSYAFDNCPIIASSSSYWEGNQLYIGKYLIKVKSGGEFDVKEGTLAIAGGVFWNATFTKLTLPSSLIALGPNVFESCSSLTEIKLPENLAIVGPYAFAGCKYLTTVTLPASVTTIGTYAFKNCTALESLTVDMADPAAVTLGNNAFNGVPTSTCVLTVPAGTKSDYAAADQWSAFTNISEGPSAISAIEAEAAPAEDVRYYDLAGRRVLNPTSGFYITSDGRKILVK